MTNAISIVVGAQAGSEAKGLYLSSVCTQYDAAVRTGAPNAGHTVFYKDKSYGMQIIPATWMNEKCKLIIGAGALIDIKQLDLELRWIEEAFGTSQKHRVFIDPKAGMLSDTHIEKEVDADIHNRIGSTAHGCGEALIDRICRRDDYIFFGDTAFAKENNSRFQLTDTAKLINDLYDMGARIVLEGTQGSALSLYHSSYAPKCTSRDTNAANWLMEAGLSPALKYEVVLVARTYPIRVAGNSGDLGEEISWCDLYEKRLGSAGRSTMEIKELKKLEALYKAKAKDGTIQPTMVHRTMFEEHPWTVELCDDMNKVFGCQSTVTRKFRRVFEFDPIYWERAVMLNRPAKVCLNFLNYKFPIVEKCKTWEEMICLPSWSKIIEYLLTFPPSLTSKLKYLGVNKTTVIQVPDEINFENFR